MADDPVTRELGLMRQDIRDDLAELKGQLGQLVRGDVYDLQRGELERRIAALERLHTEAAERRRADRRWMIGVIAVPVIIALAQIYVSLRGGG